MKNFKAINTKIINDPDKVELLKQEARSYLTKMEESRINVLSERSGKLLSPTDLEQYFRSKERNEKIGHTLQYLLTFLNHIPGPNEIEKELINPTEQFREFIRYQVDLLLEEDVKKAVFREINNLGSLNDGNVWDYQERIIKKNKELRALIVKGGNGIKKTIATLCHVLEQLSLFWLEVRHGDAHHTRRSDIYLYAFSLIVKNRCQQTMDA